MRVAIVDYGMGNLGSVRRAFSALGAKPFFADDPGQLDDADRVVLPGVGSFADGMRHLQTRDWAPELRRQTLGLGKPLLGICLGMQLLATNGDEGGELCPGLDLVPGTVRGLATMGCRLRVPHVGWNEVHHDASNRLLQGVPSGADFYFVHGFAIDPVDPGHVLATTPYGIDIASVVASGSTYGTQFHPEKSSKAGLNILRNFMELRNC